MRKKRARDHIDYYIDSMRQPSDGVLSGTERLLYNIIGNTQPEDISLFGPQLHPKVTTLDRMVAYERVLTEECHWRLPGFFGRILNTRRAGKEWEAFCRIERLTGVGEENNENADHS